MLFTAEELLLYLSLKTEGDWFDIYNHIQKKEKVDEKEVLNAKEKVSTKYFTILGKEYPNNFRECVNRPPFLLYYKGDVSLIKQKDLKLVAIIGNRSATKYGLDAVRHIIKGLPKNYVVVSGLAKGIDAAAHKAALEYGLKTIAVLGSGIDNVYPEENLALYNDIIANGGLIISEYPNKTEPHKGCFLMRNRIIAGLSDFLLVVEAFGRSGTSSTVSFALDSGVQIGAVPNPIFRSNSICNKLIKDGAYLIENGKDIVDNMTVGKR